MRTRPIVAAAILIAVSSLSDASQMLAQAEPALPAGPAGTAVTAYLAAVNAADSTAIRVWLGRYDPEGDLTVRTGRQLALARRTGGFTVERLMRGTSDAVEAVVRERKSGDRVRLLLVLGANGIAEGFGMEPMTGAGGGAARTPPSGASERPQPAAPIHNDRATVVAALRAFVDSLVKADQFSGAISLVQNGVPVFERAYGYANRATHVRNTLETAFNLGSINKLFTATAVRQLALAGKLNLDSSLARAWPDYPNPDVARRVTVRQIMEHRSGIAGDIFRVPGAASPGMITHNRQIFSALAGDSLAFAPGSRNQYSNAGYVVLGALIEKLSGEDYYDYIARHITQPAGMTRTGHLMNMSLPARTAIGYTRGDDDAPPNAAIRPNTALLPGRGSAAGGGYSTVGDLKKLLVALRKNVIPGAPPAGVGVAGGTVGVNSVVEGGLLGGYDVIVLANLDPPAAERVARRVREWLAAPE